MYSTPAFARLCRSTGSEKMSRYGATTERKKQTKSDDERKDGEPRSAVAAKKYGHAIAGSR